MAESVERAKIAVSMPGVAGPLDWGRIGPGLDAQAHPEALAQHLDALLLQVVQCARACVQQADLLPHQMDAIYLTGGSSALRPLRAVLREAFPDTPQIEGDLFGGVASGLAYATA